MDLKVQLVWFKHGSLQSCCNTDLPLELLTNLILEDAPTLSEIFKVFEENKPKCVGTIDKITYITQPKQCVTEVTGVVDVYYWITNFQTMKINIVCNKQMIYAPNYCTKKSYSAVFNYLQKTQKKFYTSGGYAPNKTDDPNGMGICGLCFLARKRFLRRISCTNETILSLEPKKRFHKIHTQKALELWTIRECAAHIYMKHPLVYLKMYVYLFVQGYLIYNTRARIFNIRYLTTLYNIQQHYTTLYNITH